MIKLSDCKRYELLNKIDTFAKLERYIKSGKASIYYRNKPYPVAFIQNWSFHLLDLSMRKKWFWSFKKRKETHND